MGDNGIHAICDGGKHYKAAGEGENGYTLTKEVSAADSALQTDEWQVVDADGAAHGGDADSISTMTSAVASLSLEILLRTTHRIFPSTDWISQRRRSACITQKSRRLRLTIQQRQILPRIPQQILHQATALQRALLPKRHRYGGERSGIVCWQCK